MNVFETITQPWREPMDYIKLVFWVAVFAIVAFAVLDGLRVVGSFVKHSVD